MLRTLVMALVVALAPGCAAVQPAMSQIKVDDGAQYQDWYTAVAKEGVLAATRNSEGDLFGFVCDAFDGCKWVISVRRPCEEGFRVAALGSSGSGRVAHLTLECYDEANTKGYFRYRIVQEEDLVQLVDGAKTDLGIVVGSGRGEFLVMRFSMNGSQEALYGVKTLLEKYSKRQPQSPDSPKRPARQIL